jgi:two-component system, cell cycle response regulator DivK
MAEESSGPLILVVDDTRDLRDLYSLYFRHVGMRAETATTVAEAVQKAVECHPDLIVMDLFLGGASGEEAVRQLKTDARTKQIPILGLSGAALQPGYEAFAVRCDAVLNKPCMPEDLAAEVRRVLKTPRS